MRPHTLELAQENLRPYFLWDEDISVRELKDRLRWVPDDDMRADYNFNGAVRGKYHERSCQGSNVVVVDPDPCSPPSCSCRSTFPSPEVATGLGEEATLGAGDPSLSEIDWQRARDRQPLNPIEPLE